MATDMKKLAESLLAKRNAPSSPAPKEDAGEDESYDAGKAAAVRDLFRALKDDDETAGAEALSEFVRLCGGK